jgi:uncharacterized membrane protein YfcA
MMDALLDPPFAKDPPVKLDIPAKTLGLVLAILGGIGTVFGLLGVMGLTAFAAAVGGGLLVLGALISLAGTALGAWGGYQMYQENRSGKRLVIYGLILSAVGGLVAVFAGSGVGSWIVNALLAFVVYYLVIISRFEGEPKPVSAVPQPPTERREGPPAP